MKIDIRWFREVCDLHDGILVLWLKYAKRP